ncbi:MAG: S1C family serine protease [Christensenellales bacterium]|jgi:serine protease Do
MRKHEKRINKNRILAIVSLALCLALGALFFNGTTVAEETNVIVDTNPAIYVAQKTANSVVGVITNTEMWNQSSRTTTETAVSQGSGVAIAEGGYVLTNYHVIKDGNSYQILLPSGEKESATLIGGDESTDIAVLKCENSDLTPVTIGSSALPVGSTVIAIGNPGGEVLANTVTSGIVSALEREVDSARVSYIQHDAPINSGNSGGGLFDVNGNLIGINTLKYAGSVYSSVSFEGLGFALPIDTVYPLALEIIEYGKVRRPQMGVIVAEFDGPDEPMANYPPASICIYTVNEGSPAEAAGVKQYDFITEINGLRVKTLRDLMTELDKHAAGDTVTLTIVRYSNLDAIMGTDSSGGYNNPFGGRFRQPKSTYETLTITVTLEMSE